VAARLEGFGIHNSCEFLRFRVSVLVHLLFLTRSREAAKVRKLTRNLRVFAASRAHRVGDAELWSIYLESRPLLFAD
jgi:hypothetical protein